MTRDKLMDAIHKYQVNYRELFEKLQILNGVSGPEREELRNQLADWIAETYPLRVRKPAKRKFAESEKNALDVVFGGTLKLNIIGGGRNYEALENVRVTALARSNLDVGYINEPEDSDYRKIASFRLSITYYGLSDEELLQEYEKYDEWEYVRKAMEKNEPLRIWYCESPRELCGFYYLCSLLVDYPADVYAVRAPERICYEKENRYIFLICTDQIDSDNAGEMIETAVKLSPAEIKMYAEEWERLKQENAPLRTVIAGKIVSVCESFYDTTIWRHIPAELQTEDSINDAVLRAMPYIQKGWLEYRINKMIDNGQIEVVEDNMNPEEIMFRKKSIKE